MGAHQEPTVSEAEGERPVIVLSGGSSSEREVSLRSGAAVAAALRSAARSGVWRGRVSEAVLDVGGDWILDGVKLPELVALQGLDPETVVFLALHGGRGEDGRIQAVLECANLRYTGSGPAASSLCMDKRAARGVLKDEGLAVPAGKLVDHLPAEVDLLAVLRQSLMDLSPSGSAWFVKPNRGGSSAGVRRVVDADELIPAVAAVLAEGDRALVEAAVVGVELSVGVLGVAGVDLRALPPVEIRPRAGGWFDPKEKYDEACGAEEICPTEGVSASVDERLRECALRAHVATGCRGYSRTDFIARADGEVFALEVNTLPGLTARSLLPLAAQCAGMDFESLCVEILRLAGSA